MAKIEYFYIYQNEQGGIELKGSIIIAQKPIVFSYEQLQEMQYPVHTLNDFDVERFYQFYYLSLHQQSHFLEQQKQLIAV